MQIKVIDFGLEQLPKRAHYNDAGNDVRSMVTTILSPNETMKIPLGFGIDLPDGFMGIIHPRSSMALKGLLLHNAPVDSGYKGEIHAIVTNTSNSLFVIEKGDRIAQLVVSPIVLVDLVENFGSERSSDGFGSTGLK